MHQRLLLSVVIISGLVPLISPIAPLASATTPQELQQCLDKFNNKDIISSSLSVADQTLLSTCRASSDCKDAGEGSLIGSRRITCTNPANNQAYQDATQKASTAETAPLIKLTCGGGGGGDTAISNYQACAQKVTSAYDACSSSGGGVTGQIQVSASSTATCLAQKYPTYTVADLQGAIESGRSAKAGILNTAANGASSTSGTASAEQAPSNACGIPDITGPLAWVMCPITSGLATFAKFLANRVGDLLYVSPETAFNDSFHGAWTSFRNIGLALVVIAGLFMVISQALGLEFLDAYTIRKLMPRLAVVMIGMTLSWPLLVQLVVLFNDLGIWAHNLILTPFDAAKVGWNAFNISSPAGAMGSANQLVIASVIERGILGVGAAGLFIGAGLLGWSGILALIGTVVLALLIGLLVLASRQVILMAAILMAPLAIACYVLPGTQKVWAFWKNTVITTLAMFPIIMGFIAIGEALSRLIAETSPSGSPWQFFAILVFFAPYFMLPFAFKLAGGLMANITNMASNAGGGVFGMLKKQRQNKIGENWGKIKSGNRFRGDAAGGLGRIFNNRSKQMYDATQTFGWSRKTRESRREAYHANHGFHEAQQIRKEHGDMMTDDTINKVIMESNGTKEDIRQRLQALKDTGKWHGDVNSAVGTAERLLNTGSTQSVMAALAMHQVSTGSGYTDQKEMLDTIARHSGGNTEMATKMLGAMRGEAKQIGRSDLVSKFGSQNTVLLDEISRREGHANNGGTGSRDAQTQEATHQNMKDLALSSFNQTDVATIARDRHESVRSHTKAMEQRVRDLRAGPPDRMIDMDDGRQMRADDLADSLTAQLQNLTDSTREYGALDRAHVAHETTDRMVDTYVPPDFIGPLLPGQPRLGAEHGSHRSRWAGDARSLNDPNRRQNEPVDPPPEQ